MAQNCLIDRVLNELKTSRSHMETQTTMLADVLDKSNNALLQIESSRTIKPVINDENCLPFTYNKEAINNLTKVVDKFTHLLGVCEAASPSDATSTNFEDYLETACQRTEYLGSNVRKLLAVWDTVQQMRSMLMHQEMETDDDEEKENNYI